VYDVLATPEPPGSDAVKAIVTGAEPYQSEVQPTPPHAIAVVGGWLSTGGGGPTWTVWDRVGSTLPAWSAEKNRTVAVEETVNGAVYVRAVPACGLEPSVV
jgi:hypothetical protein